MNFEQRLEDLIGDQDETLDTAISDYLSASAKEVLTAIPLEVKKRYASNNAVNNNAGLNVSDKEIVDIERSGYGVKQVPLSPKANVADSNSLMYGTKRTPSYYIDGDVLHIKPDPSATEIANIKTITYPTVAVDATTISGLPSTAYYAVTISAAIKLLHNKLNTHVQEDEDSELAQATKLQIDSLSAMYQSEIQRISTLI